MENRNKAENDIDPPHPPLVAYEYRPGHLYLNITNRCTNSCSFCSVKFNCGWLGPYNLNLACMGHPPYRVHPDALDAPFIPGGTQPPGACSKAGVNEIAGADRSLGSRAGLNPTLTEAFASALEAEPSQDKIIECLEPYCASKAGKHVEEVIFCGAGEPLVRLDTVLGVSEWIQRQRVKIRINTNGHALLMHGPAAVDELREVIDAVSISLNAHDELTYNKISNPAARGEAYQSLLAFAQQCVDKIPDVILSAVALTPREAARFRTSIDFEACEEIAQSMGARFRIR